MAKFFQIFFFFKNYSKNQFDAYFLNILEYYQYWLQWVSLNSVEHDCSKQSKLMKPTNSKHYYSEMLSVNVKCKWNV